MFTLSVAIFLTIASIFVSLFSSILRTAASHESASITIAASLVWGTGPGYVNLDSSTSASSSFARIRK